MVRAARRVVRGNIMALGRRIVPVPPAKPPFAVGPQFEVRQANGHGAIEIRPESPRRKPLQDIRVRVAEAVAVADGDYSEGRIHGGEELGAARRPAAVVRNQQYVS